MPPTTQQVRPGAGVHIVLKKDQPTGRTVSGTVGEILTRGNHPRGIKVRLTDGRVGRVQAMNTNLSSNSNLGGMEGMGVEQGEVEQGSSWGDRGGRRGGRRGGGRRYQGGGDEGEVPAESVGLDAYVTPGYGGRQRGNKGRGRGRAADGAVDDVDEVVVPGVEGVGSMDAGVIRCPVCDVFEGDEAAVAHHVAEHFD
ncbi:hypothetical protein BO83DRAFT_445765 [Aspergillus eucalypticola CBS 122712]|uniref:UBZ4-type domain-containing protein n=1 Tax=Aspergillus eucalypticola (strain CBS 122712 / IBT 29274) TaxID=1448314 RepID=A0A317VFK0_ASPEC|nr:uncharacterized protein BO83DRAFT_445765 [Aspergillus eucalypticola CBS 122712]PWY72665.1 hypothetical protein BO83DRAFT_445765 [Aspergillus eucalypticola CBS 122712]